MSSQVNTYVMFGVLMPYNSDDEFYDRCERYRDTAYKPEVNKVDNVTVLFDGMNGDYIALGHVIAKTANHEAFEEPITVEANAAVLRSWMNDIAAVLTKLGLDPDDHVPRWHVISHYR